MTPSPPRDFPAGGLASVGGREAGRARSVRTCPPASPGRGVRARRVRRTGELHARRRDPGAGAVRPGIAPGVSVLDLCCGVGGPGRFITRELGCDYLGVDYSAERHRHRASARRRPSLSLRGGADPPDPAGPVRRGAPARDDAGLPREGATASGDLRRRSRPAGGSPSPSKRACRSPRPSASGCPTPTPSGSSRSTRCSTAWTGSGWSSAGRKTAAGPTAPWRNR